MLEKTQRTFGFIFRHPLAKRNKTRAITELLFWQLQTSINPSKYYKKDFASKLKVLVTKGQTGMTGNLYAGLHEFPDMGFLLHFLRSEDLFVDAGANVGSYTLLASGIIGSKTIAFEPVPSTFTNLDNNIRLNKLGDLVQAYNKGLSSEKGILKFSSANDTTNHVLKDSTDVNALEVEVCTLDEILNSKCPSLIKLDVEGFETEVLKGSNSTLRNPVLKAIIIELNGSGDRYGYKDEDIHNSLVQLGFQPADYDPFARTIHFKESYGETNTIYIRNSEFVLQRLKSAELLNIFGISF